MTNTAWQNSAPLNGVLCPQCGKDDQIQRLSTIIDSGTTQTNGVGIGAVVAGAGGRHPIGVAGFTAENKSHLAHRLSGMGEPRFSWVKAFLFAWVPISVALFVVFLNFSDLGIFWSIIGAGVAGFFVSIIPALAIYVVGDLAFGKQRQRWYRNLTRLREAYYCHRDDLVIGRDGTASPEQYASWIFSQP